MTKHKPGAQYPWNRYWDKQTVLWWIQLIDESGMAMNPQTIRQELPGLYLAAHRYCGGWAKALRMAGIDPATVYVRQMQSVKEATT